MKVLFWTDGFAPRLGGVETQSIELIQAMQKRGHLYQVIAQKDFPNWKEEEMYKEIPIRRFDFNGIIENKDLKTLRSIELYLASILREFQPDIIHLNTNVGGSLFAFSLLQKMFQIPTILTCYAPYVHKGELSPLVEKVIRSVDEICCISDWVLNEIKKWIPSIENKLQRIYCGLPMPILPPEPLPLSPPVLLGFGRLSWQKGFDTLIEAFALLKQRGSNAELILAGDGPQRPALEHLSNTLGVSVTFTGALPEEEVLKTFNRSTLVIVPSVLESFGLVILEAMQMQRPVIASCIEGIPEVVADQETGLLVPGKDPVAFCNAIERLLQDPNRAIQRGVQGRQKAVQFSLDQTVLQYEELYERLVLG